MIISDLPRDLVEEIFSRLPLKSMRIVQLTCKKWETLCKSRSFTKMHTEKASSVPREGVSHQMIMLMNCNLYLKIVVFDVDPSIGPKGELTCLSEQVKISQVFHCEGLLLCILKEDSRVVVWNPYCGQTRWIEPTNDRPGPKALDTDRTYYALGYVNKKNESRRSHKLLKFHVIYLRFRARPLPFRNFRPSPETPFFCFKIYDFDSCLWKDLDYGNPHWSISSNQRGVSLKGNTYWCVSENNSEGKRECHVICFDFRKERFGPLLPLPYSGGYRDYYVTLSCVREEKLAVSLQHGSPEETEIWITTKIEADKVSWIKFLTMDMGPGFDGFPFAQGFFIDEEKKVAMGFYENYEDSNRNRVHFVGEDGYFRGLDLGECAVKGCRASVCPYVPSSVQIKQRAGGKRKKKESNLEKCPFATFRT